MDVTCWSARSGGTGGWLIEVWEEILCHLQMLKLGWIGQTATIDVLRPKLATVHKLLQVRGVLFF